MLVVLIESILDQFQWVVSVLPIQPKIKLTVTQSHLSISPKEKKFSRCSNEFLVWFYIINILMMTALRMVWIFLTSDTPNENRPRQLLWQNRQNLFFLSLATKLYISLYILIHSFLNVSHSQIHNWKKKNASRLVFERQCATALSIN